jgi:hypothetical protein
MENYPKQWGDSGPDYIINLEGPDGNVYNLFNAIEKVMGNSKYVYEAQSAQHYTNPADCAYEGYERILDYILTMCPEIELRMHGHHVQQVYPCYHYACNEYGSHNEYNSRINGFV